MVSTLRITVCCVAAQRAVKRFQCMEGSYLLQRLHGSLPKVTTHIRHLDNGNLNRKFSTSNMGSLVHCQFQNFCNSALNPRSLVKLNIWQTTRLSYMMKTEKHLYRRFPKISCRSLFFFFFFKQCFDYWIKVTRGSYWYGMKINKCKIS